MSDTPRMKAAQRIESECKVKEIWRVGCQLELELNAANESFRKLNIHALDLAARIKRLEEAGDALKAAGYFGGFNDAVDKWIKVKEAKP